MIRKHFLFSAIFLLSITTGLAQDTSKVLNSKTYKSNPMILNDRYRDSTYKNSNTIHLKPHTTINSNSGTTISNTTSGTIGSNVNPNTEFVIPFRKSKRKDTSDSSKDSEIVSPVKK